MKFQVFPFLFLLILCSCNVTKHLDKSKEERLLVKNSLDLNAPKGFRGKPELLYSIGSLYKQQPNSKAFYLFRTRLWLFYKYKDRNSKFARWIQKKVAEPPTVYSDDLTQRTARNFENYMRQRGYFNATCSYETSFTEKKAKVNYTLDFGEQYKIDQVDFFSRDEKIQQILNETKGSSQLQEGGGLSGTSFDAEKLRITNELKNRGYAFFIPNFIEFTGDSTGKRADVSVEVLPVSDTTMHATYNIGKVAVFFSLVPDYNAIASDTTLEGIYFASAEPKFSILPKHLLRAISIRPGQLYRQEDFDNTYKKLNALGIFRFVSIKPVQDSMNSRNLDVTISFARHKRLPIGYDFDLNYSRSIVSSNLLGVAGNVYFQNRNLLRGAENIVTNFGYNIEFDLTNRDRFFNSQEFKFQNDLTIPRFNDYFGVWRRLNRVHFGDFRLLNNSALRQMQNNGRSHISFSFNYLDLFQYYSYNILHGSFGYDIQTARSENWSFDHIGIDVLQPDTSRERWKDLAQNEFIRRSFGDQLFTGFLLRSFNYNFSGTTNHFGERWNFRLSSELSGAEEFAAFELWTAAFGKEDPWKIGNLNFSKFFRIDLDGSYTRDFNRDLSGVVRIGSGAVFPFGDSKIAPYVKQFFIGGPNSLRAWRIREIGPGGYFDADKQPDRPPFYQAADFRFEFNAELRFQLFWWFKGAVFLDGGNVWTLKPDSDRPGSQLRLDSYKNIALGSGVGLRADFEYFIFRLDLGLKLRRPYSEAENPGHWVFNKWKEFGLNPLNLNIAVGYPF